jgi:hypothetical protein
MPPIVFDTMKKRHYACECGAKVTEIKWGKDTPPNCVECHKVMDETFEHYERAHGVVGDEIDITIRHGICNEDGTPRRYRSRLEMRREAERRGVVQLGETPHVKSDWRGR